MCVTLAHYEVDDLLGNEDELADGLASNPLLGIGMGKDSGLYFIGSSIGRDVDGEAHLSANLDGILDGGLDEVLLFALGPLGVTNGGGVA